MTLATSARHVPELFFTQAAIQGRRVALRHKDCGIWKRISWQEYADAVRQAAAGLLALGLRPGDKVAILGDNRPEWLICHLAAMTAGGVTCGIYPTNSAEEIAYVVNHSEARILFIENEEQVDKVVEIIDQLGAEHIIIWDSKGLWGFSHPRLMFWDAFLERAGAFLAADPERLSRATSRLGPDDTAMIIYTSGTTGRPKGAMLSHRNILSVTSSFSRVFPGYDTDERLSYLPLAHIYENLISLFQALWCGGTVNFVESLDTLTQNLREVSPTIFASVPRIWEKFASGVEIKIADSTPIKRAAWRLALNVGLAYVRAPRGSSRRSALALAYWPLYALVLVHLRRQLGFERIRFAICGAAPASPELFEWYNAIGVRLREGYGQTESTGVIALQELEAPRLGLVGRPIPGMEVRIAADGEILARGDGVFQGYYKAPELSAETVDEEGWLHTGDVGALEDGHLRIMDRKKDIIITAGGKNITPSFIENKLKFSAYIQDAVVIGEGRKFLSALILIDEDTVTKYAQDHRIPFTTFADLTANSGVVDLIGHEVTAVNKTLARVETIKKFRLLPRRFYEEDGDVTPTKKVKRRALEKRYGHLIDEMYQG